MDQNQGNGAALSLEMPKMWEPFLDRAGAVEDKHFRWKSSRIPLSAKELRRNGRMGEKAMRITVVGAVLIVAAVIVAVLIVRALNQRGNRGSEANPGPAGAAHL